MSKGSLRKGDSLTGTAQVTYTEYDSEGNPYLATKTVSVSGSVTGGSSNVYVNGKQVARQGDSVNQQYDGKSHSTTISTGSSKVFINGKPAAKQEDKMSLNSSTTNFTSSSGDVIIGG